MGNRRTLIISVVIVIWILALALEVVSGNMRQPILNVLIYIGIGGVLGWVIVLLRERRQS